MTRYWIRSLHMLVGEDCARLVSALSYKTGVVTSHLLDECCCDDNAGSKVASEEVDIERNPELCHPRRHHREEGHGCRHHEDNE